MQAKKIRGICERGAFRVLCTILAGLILFFSSTSLLMAISLSELEKNLKDAILGNKDFPPEELREMDVNNDGKADVADLVRYLWSLNNGYPISLELYKWIVAASFTADLSGNAQGRSPVPVGYSFGLVFDEGGASVAEIPGFDPTKGILQQSVASAGQTAGSQRPAYAVSRVIPKDTKFSVSEAGKIVTLTSDFVTIAKDDPKNPAGLEYKRKWVIEIDRDSVSHGLNLQHGTITEHTEGFAPNPTKSGKGKIYLAPFSPKDLAPIEPP